MRLDFGSMVDEERGLIDRRIFSDPDVYSAEMERIFRHCWLLLGHECELESPNDFFTTWMGEDPVIVCRGVDGKIRAFLNLCRHRGGTVCRVDRGNTRSFLCPYHGWSFANDGTLKGVPSLDVGYRNKLGLSEWGLIEVAQLDVYKGLIFATWDKAAQSLIAYLGDMAWYLDCMLDRLDGGTELVAGTRRWVVPCNWKHAAENFIGDTYHGPFTHGSVYKVPGLGMDGTRPMDRAEGYQASPGNGHGVGMWIAPETDCGPGYGHLAGVDTYLGTVADQVRKRLGAFRADRVRPVHATVFPNFSIEFPFASLHIWHPRGPDRTEVRDLTLVDKNAPQEVKDLLRHHCMLRQGPAGTWEQDDMDNWAQVTSSARQPSSRKLMANYQMGKGFEFRKDGLPGLLDNKMSDINQRAMYARWRQLMTRPSTNEMSLIDRAHVMDDHPERVELSMNEEVEVD
jgi:3-phenylpropionate/trans-cinnamate dioxygenase subunit alpha